MGINFISFFNSARYTIDDLHTALLIKLLPIIATSAVTFASFASLITGIPAEANLGDADVRIEPKNAINLSKTYSAKCGKSQKNCRVSFKNGKLIINNGSGIYREQLVRVDTARTCRQKSILLPFATSCFAKQLDYDYVFHYKDKDSRQRSALISFWPGYMQGKISQQKGFATSLNTWRSDTTPYMTQEIKRNNKQRILSTCPKKFVKYECSWSKYLRKNPEIADWAKNNPKLANEEFKKLNILP